MTYPEKIKAAKDKKIHLPNNFLGKEIACVYGFFATKENKEIECFYIGKTTNLVSRMLGSGGHLHRFLYEGFDGYLVPQEIKRYLDSRYEIKVKILVNCEKYYKDTNFSRAAHRLALAEIKQIVKYQKKGQCLNQLPEGVGEDEKNYWEKKYKIDK